MECSCSDHIDKMANSLYNMRKMTAWREISGLPRSREMLKTIDLFAGAGGITEGFRKAGYTCVCANDVDEEAKHTFTYNHPAVPFILKDVRDLSPEELLAKAGCEPKEVDVITGGPLARALVWQDSGCRMTPEICCFGNIFALPKPFSRK